MTISTTSSKVTVQGNGATTAFNFSFVGDNVDYINVYYTNSTGTSSLLPDSAYSIVFNSIPVGGLWSIGGTVTYPLVGSPIQAGTSLTIERAVPYTQTVSISNQGAFYPQAVEQALDILELQIQQLKTDYAYTLKFPLTDILPPNTLPGASIRANTYLTFDSNGQPTVSDIPNPPVEPVAYANPRRILTTGTATVNVLTSDSFGGVSIYQSSTPTTTVQLPTTGGPYPIFDGSLNAGTYPIIVLPPAGKTILGNPTYIIAFNGASSTFYIDTTQVLVG